MTETLTAIVGCDLGDKYSHLCVLGGDGQVQERARVRTSPRAFGQWFGSRGPCTVVVEVGTHSRWVVQTLQQLGHEVVVANPRQVRLIYQGSKKNDRLDAEKLARLGRVDRTLLSPIRHRGDAAHHALLVLRSRDKLVKARTELINHVRGVSKSFGVRVGKGSTAAFVRRAERSLPCALVTTLRPQLVSIEALSAQIKQCERQIAAMAEQCAEAQPLLSIDGVGALTAMAYILTLEDPSRFACSRDVGPFLGLVPQQRQSGHSDPALRITKTGDAFVRRLLVNSAQYILGPFGQDGDLRRYGLGLMERGGKSAKKKAVIAVARKLAVLMHRLWQTGELYQPFGPRSQEHAA